MCGGEGRWIMCMNLLLEHVLHKVHTSSCGRRQIIISPLEKRNAKAKKKEAGKEGRKETT
jgi:hypothetical protein